ncbi:MAG: DUF4401 domain-containing protein, partial [Anaerolineae bacterium]|nr:DUF4401 domain-containing protein [Anaerolineae bacterium]
SSFSSLLDFCLSVTLLDGIDSEFCNWYRLWLFGSRFYGGTLAIQRKDSGGVFVSQLALAFHIAGHLLFIVGVGMVLSDSISSETTLIVLLSLIVIVLEVILIPLYEDGTFRFLATIIAVIAANVLVYELNIFGSLSILIGLLAFGVVAVWSDMLSVETQIGYRPMLQAVGYGLVFGLFGTIMHELGQNPAYSESVRNGLHQPLMTALMLLAITIWYEVRLLSNYEVALSHRAAMMLLAITVIITLPTLTTPGILAALLLIILGYRRRHTVLLVLAYLFMAGFISEYYYSLQVTLLIKSFILIGTGVLFLVGGFIFQRAFPVPEATEA